MVALAGFSGPRLRPALGAGCLQDTEENVREEEEEEGGCVLSFSCCLTQSHPRET